MPVEISKRIHIEYCTVNTVDQLTRTEQNTHREQTDTAHHGAQFISRHLNILFKVRRSCNLVAPQKQAGGLGLRSEEAGARVRSHTATVKERRNQPLQQSRFLPSPDSILPAVSLCVTRSGSRPREMLATKVVPFCGFIHLFI